MKCINIEELKLSTNMHLNVGPFICKENYNKPRIHFLYLYFLVSSFHNTNCKHIDLVLISKLKLKQFWTEIRK